MEKTEKKKIKLTKKGIFMTAVAAVLLVAGIVTVYEASTGFFSRPKIFTLADADISDETAVYLTAHRGFSAVAPENTVPAVEKAAEAGFKAVEFDVRRIADGTWVVMHNEELDDMTDGSGKIESYTYKELLEFNIDAGNGIRDYEELKVPTLREVLQKCKTLKIAPMIEIKTAGTDYIDELLSIAASYNFKEYYVISFSFEQLEQAQLLLTEKPMKYGITHPQLWWLVGEADDDVIAKAQENKHITIAFDGNSSKTSDEEIKTLLNGGTGLAAWTIDDPQRLSELYALGVTRFTTNAITYSENKVK